MRDMMGGTMSGAMGAWMIVWVLLGLAVLGLAVAGGVWAARTLAGRETGRQASGAILPPDIAEAQAVLRRRYAAGEITREDYLQAKVELEMT
jgi:putative membrane protein